jgi:hypothetical protein
MQKIKSGFAFLFTVGFCISILGQGPCPKSGSATSQKAKQLNIAKNKGVTSSKVPVFLSLDSMITTTKQDDKDWFTIGDYVVTEGFLINAIEEGAESCNCEDADATLKNGDVHMYLGLTKNAKPKNCIIIEITPAFKKKHPDYEKFLVLKKKIRVTGFLLYDYIHRKDALMTCTNCGKIWRNNSWEIHPITKIEVL